MSTEITDIAVVLKNGQEQTEGDWLYNLEGYRQGASLPIFLARVFQPLKGKATVHSVEPRNGNALPPDRAALDRLILQQYESQR